MKQVSFWSLRSLRLSGSIIFLTCFIVRSVGAVQDATPVPPPVWPETYYAPYVYPGAFPLAATATITGIRHYTLAFMLAGDGCRAAWDGGVLPSNMSYLDRDIEQLRALGGDVMVSFGGAGGDELALVCPDVESLTKQYQSIVDAYQLTHLDFDIEGDEIRDLASIERRSQALAVLQQQADATSTTLSLAFTLPVLPTGLTDEGLMILQSAVDYGVHVDVVNIMTMDFGDAFAPDKMGQNTIDAAKSLFGQLGVLYPDKTETELWGMIGLTPMIGLNDVHPEVFTLQDAETVTAFARHNRLQRLSMWALGRDRECVSGQQIVSDRCSGVFQEKFAYSDIFNAFMQSD